MLTHAWVGRVHLVVEKEMEAGEGEGGMLLERWLLGAAPRHTAQTLAMHSGLLSRTWHHRWWYQRHICSKVV